MFKFPLILFFFVTNIFSLNLTMHDSDNPSASHILDIEVINDLLIVSGMIGGIEFYDISNPQQLNHLDSFNFSGGGGGGGSIKPNCIIAKDDYAYVTTNQGLGIINISNPTSPQFLGIVPGTNNYILCPLFIATSEKH